MTRRPCCPICQSLNLRMQRERAIVIIMACNQCGTWFIVNPEPVAEASVVTEGIRSQDP